MDSLPFLPSLLPDEHIYSVCSRLAYLSLLGTPKRFESDHFLNDRRLAAGPVYDEHLTRLLALFSQQMSKEQLLKKHTPLGFYYHSMRYEYRYAILNGTKVKRDLYFAGSQIMRHAKTWRWCQHCVSEDIYKYGTSYWHLSHQLPTTTTCAKHQTTLNSKCGACDFSVQDIREQPLPPTNECPKCSCVFQKLKLGVSDHVQWIQNSGIELLSNDSPFSKPAYEFAVTYALDLLTARVQKRRNELDLFYYDRVQRDFIHWLKMKGLTVLFIDDIDFDKCRLLDLATIQSAPRKAPVISHLLWARYLGVHSLKDAKRGLIRKSA
jgi:hypothetical protein